MNKAKIISRYTVQVINYDTELSKIETIYKSEIAKHGVADEVINPILKKKEEKRTFDELLLIVKRKEIEDQRTEQLNILSTFKEFVPSVFTGELGEYDSPKPYYIEEGESVLQKWEVISNDPAKIASKISSLKSELEDSDYKVMKCYEATIAKVDEMPYDANELIESRQTKRDEINRLEALLKTTEPIDLQAKAAN